MTSADADVTHPIYALTHAMDLHPDDCSHCFNLRRAERTRLVDVRAARHHATVSAELDLV